MESRSGNFNQSILPKMRTMAQVVDEANEKIRQAMDGTRNSYITRWGKLNDSIDCIQEGEIIVIGGRPGSGKSAVANLLVQDIFDQELNPYDTVGAYFSLEMPAYQQIVRYYSNWQKMPSKQIMSTRNPISESIYNELRSAGNQLRQVRLYFYDIPLISEAIYHTVLEILHKNPGIQIVLILDHSRLVIGDAQKEERKITRFMEAANRLKNEFGVITILLSQMNRDIEKERDRRKMGQSLPVMADLFGASAVEQYATTVMLLHRPEMYGVKEFAEQDAKNMLVFNIAKQRDGWTGAVLLRSKFEYYDVHDGDTVVVNNDGAIINFVN